MKFSETIWEQKQISLLTHWMIDVGTLRFSEYASSIVISGNIFINHHIAQQHERWEVILHYIMLSTIGKSLIVNLWLTDGSFDLDTQLPMSFSVSFFTVLIPLISGCLTTWFPLVTQAVVMFSDMTLYTFNISRYIRPSCQQIHD